eukprot:TRINITY_DN13874_c4_g1_i1.p1 TRINITY_DN13874_c4_g1~~TRINITY_DN13874_c4_g1_i1.p1  ORF type:complete len:275 (+),score=21.54 TRINITY_DN13874_c4_g1_i1:73-897(+)
MMRGTNTTATRWLLRKKVPSLSRSVRFIRQSSISVESPEELELPRYPQLTSGGVIRTLDYMGTGLFACTGCVNAGLLGMDVFGCTVVGAVTALGGGTVRDILLGNTPVGWVQEPEYLRIAVVAAFGTFVVWSILGEKGNELSGNMEMLIFWVDSLGLAAFAIIGVQNAISTGLGPLPSILCGVMTATFGGLMRDSLCNKPIRILNTHDETYAAAPLSSAATYVAGRSYGIPLGQRVAFSILAALCVRYYAVENDYKLPSIKPPVNDANGQAEEK